MLCRLQREVQGKARSVLRAIMLDECTPGVFVILQENLESREGKRRRGNWTHVRVGGYEVSLLHVINHKTPINYVMFL